MSLPHLSLCVRARRDRAWIRKNSCIEKGILFFTSTRSIKVERFSVELCRGERENSSASARGWEDDPSLIMLAPMPPFKIIRAPWDLGSFWLKELWNLNIFYYFIETYIFIVHILRNLFLQNKLLRCFQNETS